MTALEAQAQVDPGVASLDAVFTNVFLGTRELDSIDMATGRHTFLR